jgi:hypothetical protein
MNFNVLTISCVKNIDYLNCLTNFNVLTISYVKNINYHKEANVNALMILYVKTSAILKEAIVNVLMILYLQNISYLKRSSVKCIYDYILAEHWRYGCHGATRLAGCDGLRNVHLQTLRTRRKNSRTQLDSYGRLQKQMSSSHTVQSYMYLSQPISTCILSSIHSLAFYLLVYRPINYEELLIDPLGNFQDSVIFALPVVLSLQTVIPIITIFS